LEESCILPAYFPHRLHFMMKHCTNCGELVVDTAKFCQKCGTKVLPPISLIPLVEYDDDVIAVEPEGNRRDCNTMEKQRGGR
jgi:RNA polymerase subunit RPABC4/transcription elongation factor Spt4